MSIGFRVVEPMSLIPTVRRQGLIFGCGCDIVTRSVSEDEWRTEVDDGRRFRVPWRFLRNRGVKL